MKEVQVMIILVKEEVGLVKIGKYKYEIKNKLKWQ